MVGGLLAGGCGGSSGNARVNDSPNGIVNDSPKQILSTAVTAMKLSSSVKVTGSVNQNGKTVGIDFMLFSNGDASGRITEAGFSADLVEVRGHDYVNATAAFWKAEGAPVSAASKLAGRWIVIQPSQLGRVSALSMATLESSLAPTSVGKLTNGGTGTIGSQHVITVVSSTQGTVWVATFGTPYPVALKGGTASSGGALVFSNWGQGSPPAAPTGATSASSLLGS